MPSELLFTFEHPTFGERVTVKEEHSQAVNIIENARRRDYAFATFTRSNKPLSLALWMISGVQPRV